MYDYIFALYGVAAANSPNQDERARSETANKHEVQSIELVRPRPFTSATPTYSLKITLLNFLRGMRVSVRAEERRWRTWTRREANDDARKVVERTNERIHVFPNSS
jgi:hypothetical protein